MTDARIDPKKITCPQCRGAGRVLAMRQVGTKSRFYTHKCGQCHGTRSIEAPR